MIRFEPLARAHLPLLTGWLQQPHVRAFWDDGERDGAAVEAHYFSAAQDVPGFVFFLNDRAAGFIQRERVGAQHEFALWALGETYGLDLLIGEPDLTGCGHGPQVIRAFMALTRAEVAVDRFLIDPDTANWRAQRAYVKAGFSVLTTLDRLTLMKLDTPGQPSDL